MLFLNENEIAGLFPVKKYFSQAATSLCFCNFFFLFLVSVYFQNDIPIFLTVYDVFISSVLVGKLKPELCLHCS